MKKYVFYIAILIFLISGCSQERTVKLEEGTPEYDLAVELATTLPFLDPAGNKILITTDKFSIGTYNVIQTMYTHFSANLEGLKHVPEQKLDQLVWDIAEDLAIKTILLREAEQEGIKVTQDEIDSLYTLTINRFGGEEKYMEFLTKNNISMDYAKNDIRENQVQRKYLDKALSDSLIVSENDIDAAYQEDKTATVRHILLLTQNKSETDKKEIYKKMQTILAKAKKGADFAELANQYSEDPGSNKNGGLYENFGRGKMVKPFEDASFNLPVGSISDIVETAYGYHIIKVIDRQKENRPRDEVKEELVNRKKGQVYGPFIEKMKELYHFKKNEI